MRQLLLIFVLILTQIGVGHAEENHRPKIGLVLSGGGARGAAHIGVIEVLEQMNIPIDIIVGTSMGAVIGGLYASGVPIEQIKQDFSTLNWDQVFQGDVRRSNLYFRRKLDSDLFIIRNFFWFNDGKIQFPLGLITGQSLEKVFKTYTLPLEPIGNFDRLKIPFKAVSTDLLTGQAVILDKGDLAVAMLASMAVPGIISPVEENGFFLVDGGLSQNVPVEIAKAMGADILIVVDVGTPLLKKDELHNAADILNQVTNLYTNENMKVSEAKLTSRDILITPDLTNISTTDFDHFQEGIEPGRMAALQKEAQLQSLSSDVVCAHQGLQRHPIFIDAVEIKGKGPLCKKTFEDYLRFNHQQHSPEEINEKVERLYGLSIFERLYYEIDVNKDNEPVLAVKPITMSSENIYLQGSIFLEADSAGNNNFTLLFGLTNNQVNSLLGEWRIVGYVGEDTGAVAEFYQPLTADLTWFINPIVGVHRSRVNSYFNYDQIGVYLATTDLANIRFGRTFSTWGELSVFYQIEYDNLKLETGIPIAISNHTRNGELGLEFNWDSFDNAFFPHHGLKGAVFLSYNDKDLGGQIDFSQVAFHNYMVPFSYGKHTIVLGMEYKRTLNGQPNYQNLYTLGGLFRLSGLVDNELIGDNSAFGDVVYYYEVGKKILLNKPSYLYLGTTLEAGRVWGEQTNVFNDKPVIGSASLFIGLDTPLGPIYLAGAVTDNGHRAAHLAMRPFFR